MKKFLTSVLLASIAFFGCKKEVKEVKQNSMEYSINGLSNLTYKYAKLSIPVEVKHLSGPQESVNLSITGLPTGMKSTLSTSSGTPTFGTFIELTHTELIAKGTYPLKFIATSNTGKSKTIDFNLTVEEICSESLKGDYSSIWNNSISFDYTLKNKIDNPNRLYFHYNNASTSDFYADVDCNSGTLIIPSQPFKGDNTNLVTGSGTFTSTPKVIMITLTGGIFSSTPIKFTAK